MMQTQTIEHGTNTSATSEKVETDPYNQGYLAAQKGLSINKNPHDPYEEESRFEKWDRGHRRFFN